MVTADTETWSPRRWEKLPFADPQAWWPESHARVLGHVRAATWPRSPLGIEEVTCGLLGTELRCHVPGPHHPQLVGAWLYALAGRAGKALRAALDDGDDWRQLWDFLRGLVLVTPVPPADEGPGVAREQAEEILPLISDRLRPGDWAPPRPVPAGEALLARDSHGSRFLLTAPFGYWDGEEDHWYAWDIDLCVIASDAVGTGSFASSADALAEWQGTVGPAGAGAELSPCDPDTAARLLAESLTPASHFLWFDECAESVSVMREYCRGPRRAQALAGSVMVNMDADDYRWKPGWTRDEQGKAMVAEFIAWRDARRMPSLSERMTQSMRLLAGSWIPRTGVDHRAMFSCSPHRIETTARTLEGSGEAWILPEWTQWCAERGGLSAAETGQAVALARVLSDPANLKSHQDEPTWLHVWSPVRKAE